MKLFFSTFFCLVFPVALNARVAWVNPENVKDPRCDEKTGYVKPTIHTDTSMEFRNFKVPSPRATFKDRKGVVLAHDEAFPRPAIWLEGGDAEKVKLHFNEDLQKLGALIGRKVQIAQVPLKVFEERRGSPIVFNQELTAEEVEKIETAKLPRIRVLQTSKRRYPLGHVFSHAVGWSTAEESFSDSYLFHPIKGRSGLENLLNTQAAGKCGMIEVLRDSTDFKLKMIFESSGTPTPLVELGLDVKLQTKVYEAISPEIKNGVVLVADTLSGEIPVMLSLPTFDPSVSIPFLKKKAYEKYAADAEEPMANKIYRNYGDSLWEKTSACTKFKEDFDSHVREASHNYARLMGEVDFLPQDKTITPLFLLTLLQRLTYSHALTFTKNKDDQRNTKYEPVNCPDFSGVARRLGSCYLEGESVGLIKKASYYLGTSKSKRYNIVLFVEDTEMNEKALLRIKKKIEKALLNI